MPEMTPIGGYELEPERKKPKDNPTCSSASAQFDEVQEHMDKLQDAVLALPTTLPRDRASVIKALERTHAIELKVRELSEVLLLLKIDLGPFGLYGRNDNGR